MKEYWLGFATPFLMVAFLLLSLGIWRWCHWWFVDRNDTRWWGGWGYQHELEMYDLDTDRWGPVLHTHWWPPNTPRWLAGFLEPTRVRICLRDPEHRAVRR